MNKTDFPGTIFVIIPRWLIAVSVSSPIMGGGGGGAAIAVKEEREEKRVRKNTLVLY